MEHPLTISEATKAMTSEALTSVELTEQVLAQADRYGEGLGVFVTRFADSARRAAEQADPMWRSGDGRPLLGIPIAIKDNITPRTVRRQRKVLSWTGIGPVETPRSLPVCATRGPSSWVRPQRWSSPSAPPTRPSRFPSRATRGTRRAGQGDRVQAPVQDAPLARIDTDDESVQLRDLRGIQPRRPARHRPGLQRVLTTLTRLGQPPVHGGLVKPHGHGHLFGVRARRDLLDRPHPQDFESRVIQLPAVILTPPAILSHGSSETREITRQVSTYLRTSW